MESEEIADQVRLCAGCQKLCRHVCPTFLAWRSDSPTPHGRALLLHQETIGTRSLDDRAVEILYQCLECSHCLSMCVTEVDIAEIVETTRTRLVSEKTYPLELDKLRDSVISTHNPFNEDHEKRNNWLQVSSDGNKSVIYFTGCTSAYREQSIATDTVSILESLNYSVTVTKDEWCCSSPLLRTGFKDDARIQAMHNVDILNAIEAEFILVTCPGCYKTLTDDFPKMDLELNKPVKHITEFLEEHLTEIDATNHEMRITYHDSCHLGRHSGIYDAPRNVINQLTNKPVVEMRRNRENAMCCGNGAGFRTLFSEQAKLIGNARVQQALDVDAEVLVTSCPFCKNMLESQAGDSLKVIDLPELVRSIIEGREVNNN
ncbi:MAG: (Fe-S)-binding protein [Candidatus Thorarchaeota archaeon]